MYTLVMGDYMGHSTCDDYVGKSAITYHNGLADPVDETIDFAAEVVAAALGLLIHLQVLHN